MKQILRLGEGYDLLPIKRHILYTLLISLYILLLPTGFARAQSASVKDLGIPEGGLKIGDTIPEALWHLPLQVVNHPEGKDTITLNDYRGKLIILDFWATWCSTCIKSIEKLSPLSHDLNGKFMLVPVTGQSKQVAAMFASKRRWSVQTIFQDTSLNLIFPHQGIPHLVWLFDSRVAAITSSSDATEKNIALMVSGKNATDFLVMKKKPIKLDSAIPLIIHPRASANQLPYYQSSLTGYADSLPKMLRLAADKGVINMINISLAELLQKAYGDKIPLLSIHQRCVWDLPDSIKNRLIAPSSLEPYQLARWEESNDLCYSLYLPGRFEPSKMLAFMREDLQRFLDAKRLAVIVEKRRIPCLVLKRLGMERREEGSGMEFKRFFYQLQYANKVGSIPLIDETGIIGKISWNGDLDLSDVENSNEELQIHGLSLIKTEREMDVLVIKSKDVKEDSL